MKPTNVLLLNLNSPCEISKSLRGIIESSQSPDLRLQQETIESNNLLSRSESALPELVSRANPAVIFLVSSWNYLKRAQSLFPSLRSSPPSPPVVVVSDTEEPDEMFEMIKLGAADFITTPLTPIGILPRLWRLLEQTCWGETLAHRLKEKFCGTKMLIGESPAFVAAANKVPLVAKCDASVMISGETGTGKELFARAIHELSLRANGPFIPVNCGAIPVELVENELFGHERGAFTGAIASKLGLAQEANGGTLFLDEIDSLPLLAQVKLLRFLQEKEYRPLGSTRTRQADVRVITATNINVERALSEGKLRQDLYYRLDIIPLLLPPLRDRRDDIPLLANHFLTRYAAKFNKRMRRFSPDAMQKLLLYEWPGNVREMENVIERSVALCEQDTVRSADILISRRESAAGQDSFQKAKAKVVAQFERTYIQSLLLVYEGNVTRAAKAAQKDRRALWQLIRKHEIDVQRFRAGTP